MEAKDTVVHADGCSTNLGIIGAVCNCGAEAQAEISFRAGIRKGIRMYAWWQDGVQYVGTTGRTMKDALQEYED